uniref:Serine/threonine/tyrosine kinase 1a n=1 Tax=Mastacembelus armatus TaxID=205130 RepID=A0A3Q3MLP0_9TELE
SMSSNNSAENLCAPNDNLCIIKKHDLAVIIVPTLLLVATVITLVALFSLKYCHERKGTRVKHKHSRVRPSYRPYRQGIDAPPGINPLEHEELPMSVQVQQNAKTTQSAVPQRSTERNHDAFSQVTALPPSIFRRFNHSVSLYRARMNNKDVILRVLKERADDNEKEQFLGFASFMSGLGPHPFLPALLGVVSVQSPLTIVGEELRHRDLLQFLWRCRQDNSNSSSCDMTEKRLFTMATQVASALDYLHSQRCIHGNLGARNVLVGEDLTAKLWGLGPAYRRKTSSVRGVEDMELKKWQAPEVLVRREISQSRYHMYYNITLPSMYAGDPPFAQIMANELLQYLQRGKHLKRPATCSNTGFSIIKSCCHWNPQQRLSVAELITKLQAGEKSANGRTVLRVSEPIDIEKYMREAGYGEGSNFAVL